MYSFFPIPNAINALGEQPDLISKIIIAGTLAIIILGLSGFIKICEITYKKITK